MKVSELKKIEWDRYVVRQYSFFFWSTILQAYSHYRDFVKINFDYTMMKYSPLDRVYYRSKKKRIQIEYFLKRNVKNLSFVKGFAKKLERLSNKAIKLNRRFHNQNLTYLSNKELLKEFEELMKENSKWIAAVSSNILVIGEVFAFIQDGIMLPKLKEKGKEKEINQLMGKISFPKGIYYKQEELDLINVAKEKNQKKFNKLLSRHIRQYAVMNYFNTHHLLERKEFIERINELRRKGIKREEERILNFLKEQEKGINVAYKCVGLSKKEIQQVNLLRKLLFLRILEEYILSSLEFTYDKIFKETVKRFPLSMNQLRFSTIQELYALYEGKKIDLASINKREDFSLLVFRKGKLFVFVDEKAERLFKKTIKERTPERFSGVLKGTPATRGKAKGRAKIILHISHLLKFRKGNILVSPNTNPAYVPAMKKAAAIVTDEGGITCHAAIVSRELGIPCVTGTKFATSLLKDNDLLSVRATEGIVKKVNK